jgi:hypothetical protein
MPSNKIERRIYFYRILCKKDKKEVNLSSVFSHIDTLSFNSSGRYFPISNDRILSMYVESTTNPIKVKLGTIRKSGLPLIEKSGNTTPLSLPIGAGLYEPVHIMIFENNVMGFESNYYGPRPGTLTGYLPVKASSLVDSVDIKALVRQDVLKMLKRVGEIKMFQMSVQRDMQEHLSKLDESLSEAFKEMKEFTDAETLEIILKPRPYDKKGITISFLKNVTKLIEWLRKPGIKEGINKLKIKGLDVNTGGRVYFNLLQQYLISKKTMVLQDSSHRAVDSDSAYGAILEAYMELKEEINAILGINER